MKTKFLTLLALSLSIQLLAQNVNDYQIYQKLGRDYIIKGNYDSAIIAYDKSLSIMQYSSSSLYERGFAKMELTKYKEAISDFTKVIELAPHKYYALTNRALCYMHLEKVDEAKKDIDAALLLDPEYKPALEARGQINEILDFRKKVEQQKIKERLESEQRNRYRRRRQNAGLIAGTLIPIAFWTTIFLTW